MSPAARAAPPMGQIQKRHLRTVSQLRALLTTVAAGVPARAADARSSWFAKAQAYQAGLDAVAANSLLYAANQATIAAKWNERAAWGLTQRPPH